jgi:hypothetical protein
MKRRVLIALVVAASLAAPAAAPAYPPITCGRTTVAGTAYIVRTHGPKCAKAIAWSRTYIRRQRAPAGFRCRAYGTDVPAHCIRTGRKNSYFFATKA